MSSRAQSQLAAANQECEQRFEEWPGLRRLRMRSLQPAPPPAFVQLRAPAASQPCECTIEIEGPRGRMRIEWKGSTAPDLPGLSRVLWEPGS